MIHCSCITTDLSNIVKNKIEQTNSVKYSLVKCPDCNEPILLKSGLVYEINQFVWAIPEKLRHALIECLKCYRISSFDATALMCRKVLEMFCVLKGVKIRGSNLKTAIHKLRENDIINEQLFAWAESLRDIGNKAAHDIDTNFTSQDAKDILDFTIAILDFTYSFKEKFEKFQLRNKKQ